MERRSTLILWQEEESGIPSILRVKGNPNRFEKYVRGAATHNQDVTVGPGNQHIKKMEINNK